MKRQLFFTLVTVIPLLVSIISVSFAEIPQPQEEPATYTYYFITYISDEELEVKGVCIIEFDISSDSLELVKKELEADGFIETKVDDIHSQGYFTPKEAFDKSTNRDGGETEYQDRYYSWCDAYGYSGAKMVSAGSYTERRSLGSLRTTGTLTSKKWVGNGWVNYYNPEPKVNYNRLGHGATVSFQILYPGTIMVKWNEAGKHEFAGYTFYTNATDTY